MDKKCTADLHCGRENSTKMEEEKEIDSRESNKTGNVKIKEHLEIAKGTISGRS